MKKEKLYPAYISKHNLNREKQVIFLRIPNRERWYYLAVQKLSALLRIIISKHRGETYCLNFLHSLATENKRESQKKYEKVKIFVIFNQYQQSDKAIFIIYSDLEYLIERLIDVKLMLKIHPEKSEHIPSRFSMSTTLPLRSIESMNGVYRGKDCMKKFCES